MSTYLPQEIVERILCKLPIKSRFRFLAVSKEWRNLITLIPNIPTNKTKFLIACAYSRNSFEFYIDNNDEISEGYAYVNVEDDDEEEEKEQDKVLVTASGYGLIVLRYFRRVILWNPFTFQAFTLPQFRDELFSSDDCRAFGVLVDYMSNECKVLMMDEDSFDGSGVEIFRLSTDSWESLIDDAPFCQVFGCQVEIRGVLYWIGEDDDLNMLLVSFDGHTELFSTIELPLPDLQNNKISLDFNTQLLFLFNDSLIYIHGEDYVGDNEKDVICCKIWKMVDTEGKDWELYQGIFFPEYVIPLGFRENGEFLWVGRQTKKFMSTDLTNGWCTILGTHHADRVLSCPNFVESVALIDLT